MKSELEPSMMARFTASAFEPVDLDGTTVHAIYRRPLSVGDVFTVEWVTTGSPRVQGLSLRLRIPDLKGKAGEGGMLEVEDTRSPSLALWRDGAPDAITVCCVESREGSELWVSNRWRDSNGREDEWLNNFGIVVEAQAGGVLLRCSDGYGGYPTFTDLVVRLAFVQSA